jgi:hypothetical protein
MTANAASQMETFTGVCQEDSRVNGLMIGAWWADDIMMHVLYWANSRNRGVVRVFSWEENRKSKVSDAIL